MIEPYARIRINGVRLKIRQDYEKLLNHRFEDVIQSYDSRDTILYALSLGLGSAHLDPDELKYVYERDLQVFPTMAVILGHPGAWMREHDSGIDMRQVLHGEQHLEILQPLPPAGTVIGRSRVVEIIDKGLEKGALIVLERRLFDQEGERLLSIQHSVIVTRANGGFCGPVTAAPPAHPLPERKPDWTIDIATSTRAALLYRLNGDYNPLHVDPDVARMAGFSAPILHGLASYGVAARAVLMACADQPQAHLLSFGVRFSAPVYPGETIRTDVWREREEISFRSRVVARGNITVLNNGRAVVRGES